MQEDIKKILRQWQDFFTAKTRFLMDYLRQLVRTVFSPPSPDLASGVDFFLRTTPEMMKRYGIEEPLDQLEGIPFYDEILNSIWEDRQQIGIGGLETVFIFLNRPPVEQSYEYLGEMVGRAVRSQFSQDRSRKTRAFFGWVGRHVMKKVCPETDFSFDRHRERVDKERVKVTQLLTEALQRIEEGLAELETPEQAYDFFSEIYSRLPSFGSGGTPLEERITHCLWVDYEAYDYLPTHEKSWRSFGEFKGRWHKAAEIGIPAVKIKYPWEKDFLQKAGIVSYETWVVNLQEALPRLNDKYYQGLRALLDEFGTQRVGDLPEEKVMAWYQQAEEQQERERANWALYYWQQNFQLVFGEVVFHPEEMAQVADEELLLMWFEMPRCIIRECLQDVLKEARSFNTTYFRFIEDPAIAAGYAFAQQHLEGILTNLPEIIRMPEEEIFRRFLSGQPQILSDEQDFGHNTSDDWYRSDLNRDAWYQITQDKSASKKDGDWAYAIYSGPNTKLYEELKTFVFTQEQWVLGIMPLFLGLYQSDCYARYFFGGEQERDEIEQRWQGQSSLQRERERIDELEEGRFCLPQTPGDLLINADWQIRRLSLLEPTPETTMRIKMLREVRAIIQELMEKDLIRPTNSPY